MKKMLVAIAVLAVLMGGISIAPVRSDELSSVQIIHHPGDIGDLLALREVLINEIDYLMAQPTTKKVQKEIKSWMNQLFIIDNTIFKIQNQ